MNGRVYDYNVGRFMSVDPVIQSPTNSQSINPYSYILNNPMAGTDPTGYVADYEEVDFDASTIESIDVFEDGSITVNFNNGAESQSFSNASINSTKATDIASQTTIATSSRAAGNNTSNRSSGNLSDDIQKQSQEGINSIGKDLGKEDDSSVAARYDDFEHDEEDNVNQATVLCDFTCRKNAEDYHLITTNDIANSAMIMNFRRSQTEVAEGVYQVLEKASYVYIGIELAAAAAVRWALMSASQKIAWFSVVGDGITISNGATQAQWVGGWAVFMADQAAVRLYVEAAKKGIPQVMKVRGWKESVKVRDGKYVFKY